MPKPFGGRGCKAPYQTMIICISVDVKPQIDEIFERFRSGNLELAKINYIDNDRISQLTIIIE